MRIAHECPISIFDRVQEMTDYDYCLVHLMDENEQYRDLFLKSRAEGNEIILDNSIFELGEAYDSERYHYWVQVLKPDYFIIPDVLNDMNGTIERAEEWFNTKEPVPGSKSMCVVQGSSIDELTKCYLHFANDPRVDKIGISFDSVCYYDENSFLSREEQFMKGRASFLSMLNQENHVNRSKPHHLLGCSLPQEMFFYRNLPWVDTVDTSSPVVNGLLRTKYSIIGLEKKPSVKLFTLINDQVDGEQMNIIEYNINMFRSFCN